MINFEEALKKPFIDLSKLILGIILSVIPIVNWIAQGFIIETSGMGKNKPSKSMPEWKDFGDYFVKGLLSYVIMFVYALPAIIVFSAAIGYAAASLVTTFTEIMPQGFMSQMMAGTIPKEQAAQLFSQNWMMALPTLITVAPLIILGLVLILAAAYLSPVAILNYLKNKRFGKAFDINFVTKKAFTSTYFIAWFIGGIIGIVLSAILSFIPFIGPAAAFFIKGVIVYTLYGQAFREK